MNPQQGQELGGPQPWMQPPPQQPPLRRPRFSWTALIAAVLAAAALVVAIIALAQARTTSNSTSPSSLSPSTPPTSSTDYTSANRALCTAIAPLMSENDRQAKAFSNLGPAGSPGWDAGKETFISYTKDWVGRIQPVIDSHANVDPYFRRSLQRFVDDQRFLIADIEVGPWQPYDQTIWNDSLAAGSGPLSICWGLGVKW